MRLSDLLVVLAASAVVLALPRLRRSRATATLSLLTVAMLHLADGLRWQLVPALALLGLGVAMLQTPEAALPLQGRFGRGVRRTAAILGLIAVAGSAAAAAALPVSGLPVPDGPRPVGTVTFVVEEPDRQDPYAPDDRPRRFPVQLWYPAAEDGPAAPWIAADEVAAFSAEVTTGLGLPPFALRHLTLVDTHATTAAQPAAGRMPVVVYSHGWGGFRSIQSDLAEELASRGYLVVAPDHTYGSLATRFPGGDVIALEPDALPDAEDVGEDEYGRRSQLLERTYASDVLAALDALAPTPTVDVELPDPVGAVLDALDADLDNVVLTGHSTGGGAVTWACAELADRCGGVVGFDPWLVPLPDDVLAAGPAVPYVALRSEEWLSLPNDEFVADYLDAADVATWALSIPGSEHRDFTLLGFLSPLAGPLGLSGDVAPEVMHDAIDAVTVTFVDHVFAGGGTALLDDAAHPALQAR